MTLPSPLHQTPESGLSIWLRHRHRVFIVAAAAIVAVVVTWLADPTADTLALRDVDGDVIGTDARPAAAPDERVHAGGFIDHSVVETRGLADDPDTTGASIGNLFP